jgi:hypothetical protein
LKREILLAFTSDIEAIRADADEAARDAAMSHEAAVSEIEAAVSEIRENGGMAAVPVATPQIKDRSSVSSALDKRVMALSDLERFLLLSDGNLSFAVAQVAKKAAADL